MIFIGYMLQVVKKKDIYVLIVYLKETKVLIGILYGMNPHGIIRPTI